MDKSVAQKLMIVMSLFTAVFATVFVCGNIVNSSSSTDSYIQPVPKTHYVVTYSDTSIDETQDEVISQSDIDAPEDEPVITTSTTQEPANIENGVTVVEFVDDDDEDYTSETMNVAEEDIDNQFLYMTTVTTKLPAATFEQVKTTTTVKSTATTTRKTTRKTTAVTAAKPYTTRKKTAKTTTSKKTTVKTTVKTTKSTTEKIPSSTKNTTAVQSSATTTTKVTTTTASTTASTTATTKAATQSTTASTSKPTTKAVTETQHTTTPAPTTTTKAPQIGGAVSINKRTTTESTAASEQP